MLTLRSRRPRPENVRRIVEDRELLLPGSDLAFRFQRDGCRTLRMAVRADGSVTVKAPARLPLENVFAFLRSRLDWVKAKKDFFARHRGAPVTPREGERVFYLGRPFVLCAVPAGRRVRARLRGGALELPLRPDVDETRAARATERAFRRWRLDLATLVLTRRLRRMERLANAVFHDDAAVSAIVVRSLRRRWGSCSVRGEITLAAQLIAMPLPLVDYVLCHELCHLRAMNHGPRFYALLRALLPDADERRRRIRIWSLEHPR